METVYKGLIIVLSGPSGVGKDTVLKELLAKNDRLKLSVSATTREPRQGEVDKKDYYFMDKEDFRKMIDNNGTLEHAEYCGNFYGTPKRPVFEETEKGNDVILEIETRGAFQVMDNVKNTVSIFIMPPSFDTLQKRLEKRNTDNIDTIKKRVVKAREEIKKAYKYDYIVVNDDLEACVDDILNILRVEKLKAFRKEDFVKGVLNNG